MHVTNMMYYMMSKKFNYISTKILFKVELMLFDLINQGKIKTSSFNFKHFNIPIDDVKVKFFKKYSTHYLVSPV